MRLERRNTLSKILVFRLRGGNVWDASRARPRSASAELRSHSSSLRGNLQSPFKIPPAGQWRNSWPLDFVANGAIVTAG